MDLDQRLSELAAAVDDAGQQLVAREEPYRGLYDMLRYHLGWEELPSGSVAVAGKRLRPAICLLVAEAVCGDWRRALAPATALELVHNFSLIHDDIQDRSLLRRHRPTVWSRWGIAQGINAGDILLIIAQRALFEIEPRLPPNLALGAFRFLNSACQGLCEGQYLDLLWEDRPVVLVDQYLEMIGKKTACLFSAAAEIGAYCALGSERVQHTWASYGRALGMAFQVVDDLLGVWGPEVDTGKTADLDVATRKKTLPVVLSLGASASPEADRLRALFALDRRLTAVETTEATQCLTLLGAREATAEVARRYQAQAVQCLDDLAVYANVSTIRALTQAMLPELHDVE